MANPVLQVGWSYYIHSNTSPNLPFNTDFTLSGISPDGLQSTVAIHTPTEYKTVVGDPKITPVQVGKHPLFKNHK